MQELLKIETENFVDNVENRDMLVEAIKRISNASEAQFEEIKKEKWYNRLFDLVTFSKKGEKRLAQQITTVAQTQQILIEILLRLSENDAEISDLVQQNMQYIKQLQGQDVYLLERIQQLEKLVRNNEIGIKKELDISDLSDKNKEILYALLIYLAENIEYSSDEQKKYANIVLKYIGKPNVQMEIPLKALDDVESDDQKKMLACCMEYMFLNKCNMDDIDEKQEYSDFIDEFDVSRKSVKLIKEQILKLYKLTGIEGFYNKYDDDNFDEIPEEFAIEFDDDIVDYQVITTDNLEDYCISNILQVPSEEIKKFINKNITLRAYINCEGTLEFENCIITYNDDLKHYKIELAKNAELHIKNCIIRCKGFDKESFIISNGSNKIKLEQSTFEDCSNFLVCEYYNDANDITIENNKFQNCAGNVFYLANDDRAVFNHNFVIVEKFAEFNDLENSDMKGIMFWLNKSRVNNSIFIDKSKPKKSKDIWEFYRSIQFLWSKGKTENCRFYGLKDKVECVTFKNCYFEGCNACLDIQDEYKGVIDSCVFKNCTKIANFLSSDEIVIKNCQFIDCYNNLIETGLDGGLKIEYCDFINIKEIKNDQYGHFCIELKRSDDSDSNCNFIRNCIFRGIKLDQRFLIGSSNIEKVDGYTGRIEKCTFENCITNRSSGQIIKHYIQYTSFFREKDDYTITDENCVGLDKVNRYVSNDGRVTDYQEKKVGAVITEDEVGCKLSVQI